MRLKEMNPSDLLIRKQVGGFIKENCSLEVFDIRPNQLNVFSLSLSLSHLTVYVLSLF